MVAEHFKWISGFSSCLISKEPPLQKGIGIYNGSFGALQIRRGCGEAVGAAQVRQGPVKTLAQAAPRLLSAGRRAGYSARAFALPDHETRKVETNGIAVFHLVFHLVGSYRFTAGIAGLSASVACINVIGACCWQTSVSHALLNTRAKLGFGQHWFSWHSVSPAVSVK